MDFKTFRPISYATPETMLSESGLPYDVLSQAQIKELIDSPNHVMNIEAGGKGKEFIGNPYLFARSNLSRMLLEGILLQHPKECYVVTQETFQGNGETREIRRIWGIVPNQEYRNNAVMRHENIREHDRDDRKSLLDYLGGFRTKPTWLAVEDSTGSLDFVMKEAIDMHGRYLGEANGRQITYAFIEDENPIKRIASAFVLEPYSLIIDGHHGFASSEAYGNGKQVSHDSMLCCVSSEHAGSPLIIPTYRIIAGVLSELPAVFENANISIGNPFDLPAALKDLPYHFGIIRQGNVSVIRLKEEFHPDGKPIEALDVYQLHEKLLNPLGYQNGMLSYNADLEQATQTGETVIFVKPPVQRQVWEIAKAGDVTPPKSTFYLPKAFSGLFCYKPA